MGREKGKEPLVRKKQEGEKEKGPLGMPGGERETERTTG